VYLAGDDVYNWTLDIVIFRYPPPISRPLSIGYTTRSQLRLAKKIFFIECVFFYCNVYYICSII